MHSRRAATYSVGFSAIVSNCRAVSESVRGSGNVRCSRKSGCALVRFPLVKITIAPLPCSIRFAGCRTSVVQLSPSSAAPTSVTARQRFLYKIQGGLPEASSRNVGTTSAEPLSGPSSCDLLLASPAAGRNLFRIQLTCRFAYCRVEIFIRSMAAWKALSRSRAERGVSRAAWR